MAPIPPDEIIELMRFVAKKSIDVKAPMNMRKLCRQFVAETESRLTVGNVKRRILYYRGRIHEMEEFDMETRVRMMLALRAPVDDGFLVELRKDADVEVDDQYRIVGYKKRGDSKSTRDGNHGNHKTPDGHLASPSVKRTKDSEADTAGERKKARTAPESSDDDEESMSNGEETSSSEGHNITENNDEVLPGPTEIDQKPVDFIQTVQNSPADLENLVVHVPEDVLPEEPETSVRDLLILLRGLLLSVSSRHLNGLRRKIEEKIQKLSSEGDQLVSLETINLPFDMCLHLLKKHASPKSEDESTSLRRFMTSLQTATCHLVHPSMDPFHEKVNAYLDELDVQDHVIPIKIVHNAMDSVINFIDS